MKKAKKIAIIFAIVLLIGACAFAAVYYLTDIFKTPQDAFYSYIEKAAKMDNATSYQEMLEELKAAKEKSYKSETSIGVEIDSKRISDKQAQQMQNMLKNVKLNVNSNVKPSENKSTSEISLNFGGFSAGDLKLVKDGEVFGIKSDLLDNKYIAVENNNLKDLFSKLGAKTTNIPNKFESIDLYDLLYVSKEDQFNLEKTYKNIFKDTIPAENYTKQENITQKVNGQDVNTTAYTLSLGKEDLINVIVKLLETAEEDDTLLNIITEKVNKLVDNGMFDQMNASTSYSLPSTIKSRRTIMANKISTDQLKQRIKELINDLKSENNYTSSSKVEIILYVANNDIVKMELKANDEVLMAMDFYNSDDMRHIVFYAKEKSYPTYGSYVDYYRPTKQSSKLVKLMEIEYKSAKNGDTKTEVVGFSLYDDEEKIGKILIDLNTKGKKWEGKSETTGKIAFETEAGTMSLIIDSKVEYTDDVSVESLDRSNSNVLNNMTEKEIKQYFEKISKNVEDTFSMFGINNKVTLPRNNNIYTNTEIEEETQTTEEQQTELENLIKEQQESIEKKVEENKEKIDTNTKQDMEKLQKQLEEINKAMKELEEKNS
ncbi:MAG: hypothetical protein J6N78_00875 [Clostridia bacterium]|nr:hypothetical protein [Clostridia bacterium]